MSDALGALFRADSWNFPGLKDGQILRTISNVTYSESHYASDEEKLPLEGARRHRLAETTLPGDGLSRESPQRASESPPTATACTLSVQGTTSSPGSSKGHMHFQQTILSCGNQKARSLQGAPTFDIVATAGLQPGRDALQHFPLPDKSGLFADMLGHLDFNGSGGTLSPKLLSVQLQNLGHLFDDLDKAGSDVSECPDTPLHLFPNTPTSDLLLQGHFNHFFPEAQTPPQMTPSPPLRGSRCGQDSQQLSLETSMQQSPMSPLIGDSRAHSMPNPLPSPVPLRSPGPYSPAHSHQPRLDHHHHSPMNSRTVSMPLPALLEPYRFPPPVRTSMHEASPSARHSPARPAGIRKVQAGQHGKPKVTGRRSQLLLQSAHAEMRRAGSLAKSEDSASAAATDSEADSITTDGGSHKRKPGSKKGAGRRARRMTCRNCATHQTPQWRCGPEGPRTLCNACGVRYKKGLPLTNSWAGKSAGMPPSGSSASALLPPAHRDSPSIA